MFDDDDFNIFDDKQTEKLNAVEKPENEEVADQADDTTSTDTSASEDDKADDKGTDDKSGASDGEETSEAKADDTKSDDKADGAQDASADASSDQAKKDDDTKSDDKADDAASDDKKEQFATKDDIRAALAEQTAHQEAQQTTRKALRNELRTEVFPEGIDFDLKIKDSDNGVITGPSQIAGKLINPNTQELFTYEEAKDYWDNAQKQIDRVIEQREQLIDLYAENNQSFFEGSQIVEQKYGAFLKANPEIAKQLLDNYLATAKITKSGYITEMPLNVVAYYDTAMRPMQSIASQMELNTKAEEARKVVEDEKKTQADRADLPVNSTTTPPVKKDELSSAFDRYFSK